jgi:hypothetical protein
MHERTQRPQDADAGAPVSAELVVAGLELLRLLVAVAFRAVGVEDRAVTVRARCVVAVRGAGEVGDGDGGRVRCPEAGLVDPLTLLGQGDAVAADADAVVRRDGARIDEVQSGPVPADRAGGVPCVDLDAADAYAEAGCRVRLEGAGADGDGRGVVGEGRLTGGVGGEDRRPQRTAVRRVVDGPLIVVGQSAWIVVGHNKIGLR